MELGPLETFALVARTGQITRAAARLHLTQPAVSAQIARLEAELGHQLLERGARGVSLTDSGRLLLGYVEEALGRLAAGREALAEQAGLERGAVAIGGGATATTCLLPELLGEFRREHPAIRLFVREQGSEAVRQAVLADELHLGFVTVVASQDDDPRLAVEPWCTDELRLVVPPGHRLIDETKFRWADLQGEPMVLFEPGTAVREIIDRRLAAHGVQPEIAMELRSIAAIQRMVAAGIGVALISRFALGSGEGLTAEADPPVRDLAVIFRRDRALGPAPRAFLRALRKARPLPA